jgi:signal recognition particle GTPase
MTITMANIQVEMTPDLLENLQKIWKARDRTLERETSFDEFLTEFLTESIQSFIKEKKNLQ